jgi:hypothetical protein
VTDVSATATEQDEKPKEEMTPEEREWRAQIHMAVLTEMRLFVEENKQVITERAMAKLKAAQGKSDDGASL